MSHPSKLVGESRRFRRHMRMISHPTLALCALLLQCGAGRPAGDVVETVERRLAVSNRARLVVINLDGPTTIVAGEAGQVSIKAAKEVRGAANPEEARMYASRVEVRIEQAGDKIEIETKYPKGWSASREQPRVRVRLDVTAPAQSDLNARSTSGPLDVEGFQGRIELSNSGGELTVRESSGRITAHGVEGNLSLQDVSGVIDARTTGGSVKLTGSPEALQAASATGRVEIHVLPGSTMKADWSIQAGNGNVRLYLPDNFAANLDASTSAGEIMTDKAMDVTGTLSKRHLTGRLGGGGMTLRIHSTNGDVRILRQ